MSRSATTIDTGVELDLERAMLELHSLGASLATSYRALEERAQRVEQELARANRELEDKVAQLDAVSADLEAVLAALPTGVIVRDAHGSIVRTNRAALQVLGLNGTELSDAEAAALAADGEAGDEWSEREWIGDDGRRRIVARRRSPVSAAPGRRGGRNLGSVEILDDRTQLAELNERLHALDKLAALGDMAGGIAHEVRNPLMAVQGFAALLAARLERDSDECRWATLIVEGADEANQILTSMLSLAKPDELLLSTVEAAELARAAERLTAPAAGETRPWTIDTQIDCPPFVGDRIKLRQALRNLIANALQAQPDGGRVSIEIVRDAGDVLVRVSDAGPGFPREVRRRALEPFFTTRAEGTGLGLALVQRIAEVHGGRVEIRPENSVLGGAEVCLRIPFRCPLN